MPIGPRRVAFPATGCARGHHWCARELGAAVQLRVAQHGAPTRSALACAAAGDAAIGRVGGCHQILRGRWRVARLVKVKVRAGACRVAPALITTSRSGRAATFGRAGVDPPLKVVAPSRACCAMRLRLCGINQALVEQTITDRHSRRIANATLGDHLIPISAAFPTSTPCSWPSQTH